MFDYIYEKGIWGSGDSPNSGAGSSLAASAHYLNFIASYVVNNNISQIIDIGCGDFQVGKELQRVTNVRYLGIDGATVVINRNNELYASEKIKFLCVDVIKELPPATKGLVLIRQVLQHLSNQDIIRMIENLKNTGVEELIVTEHVPLKIFSKPNFDIHTGPETRIVYGSGVFLDMPPFRMKTEILYEHAASPHHFLKYPIETKFVISKVFIQ